MIDALEKDGKLTLEYIVADEDIIMFQPAVALTVPVPTRVPALLGTTLDAMRDQRKISVQLLPYTSLKFTKRLQEFGMNPKLRVDGVRSNKPLSLVIEHMRRRWKDHLVKGAEIKLGVIDGHYFKEVPDCTSLDVIVPEDGTLTLSYIIDNKSVIPFESIASRVAAVKKKVEAADQLLQSCEKESYIAIEAARKATAEAVAATAAAKAANEAARAAHEKAQTVREARDVADAERSLVEEEATRVVSALMTLAGGEPKPSTDIPTAEAGPMKKRLLKRAAHPQTEDADPKRPRVDEEEVWPYKHAPQDGRSVRWALLASLRIQPLEVGFRVQGKYQGKIGGFNWFYGVVSRVHNDGTCDIAYDDGDIEQNVASRFIKVPMVRCDAQGKEAEKVQRPSTSAQAASRRDTIDLCTSSEEDAGEDAAV